MKVRTTHDFTGDLRAQQLSFQKGTILQVEQTDNGNGWSFGYSEKDGLRGWYPTALGQPLPVLFRALYDFIGERACQQLSFPKNSILVADESDQALFQNGWGRGKILETNHTGWFPLSYVEMIKEEPYAQPRGANVDRLFQDEPGEDSGFDEEPMGGPAPNRVPTNPFSKADQPVSTPAPYRVSNQYFQPEPPSRQPPSLGLMKPRQNFVNSIVQLRAPFKRRTAQTPNE